MIKFVDAAGWDFGDAPVALVKVSRRGLVGEDRKAFVKRAGDLFLKKASELTFHPDEEVAHTIALGCTEVIGPNRRGDGFRRKVCNDRCYTFAKYAHPFRNHKDEDPRVSFGRVIASGFNEPMGRVELLTGYSRTKEAADRNRGLVADRECQKLLSGEDIPVSMGCKLAYDTCSYCGNKAPTPEDYCTPSSCAAGGLRDYMGKIRKVAGDLHHLHADNDPGLFFHDISAVWRPADRTAYASRADYLTKRASAPEMAETAAHFKLRTPAWLLAETASEEAALMVKVAEALGEMEDQSGAVTTLDTQWGCDLPAFPWFQESKRAEALMTLAERGVVASIEGFADLYGRTEEVAAARRHLPGIYGKLTKQGSFETWCDRNEWTPVGAGDRQASRFADSHAHELGLTPEGYRLRAVRSSIAPRVKHAAAPGETAGGEKLAFDYARYKVAALTRYAPFTPNLLLTLRSALAQDRA